MRLKVFVRDCQIYQLSLAHHNVTHAHSPLFMLSHVQVVWCLCTGGLCEIRKHCHRDSTAAGRLAIDCIWPVISCRLCQCVCRYLPLVESVTVPVWISCQLSKQALQLVMIATSDVILASQCRMRTKFTWDVYLVNAHYVKSFQMLFVQRKPLYAWNFCKWLPFVHKINTLRDSDIAVCSVPTSTFEDHCWLFTDVFVLSK